MSKQKHDQRYCPPGSVAAGQSRPVMREPLSGGRRPSPHPEDTHSTEPDSPKQALTYKIFYYSKDAITQMYALDIKTLVIKAPF